MSQDETVVRHDGQRAKDAPQAAQLVVIEGPSRGAVIMVSKDQTRIGRLTDNEVVLDSPSVSKHHAQVLSVGGTYQVEDLGSTNGVLVNGVKIQVKSGQRLVHGDAISIGDSILLFRHEGVFSDPRGFSTISLDVSKVREEADALLKDFPAGRPPRSPA